MSEAQCWKHHRTVARRRAGSTIALAAAGINLWFEGEAQIPFPAPLRAPSVDEQVLKVIRILRQQPAELRAFCKDRTRPQTTTPLVPSAPMLQVWYSDLFVESLRDAFEASDALEAALKLHQTERPGAAGTTKLRLLLRLECQHQWARQAVESRIAPATLRLLREFLPLRPVAEQVEDPVCSLVHAPKCAALPSLFSSAVFASPQASISC